MRHRDLIAAIARRLPDRTRREVEEVIDVLIELLQDDLAQGEAVSLPNIGTIHLETQQVRASQIVRQHPGFQAETIFRICGRFRPAQELKDRLKQET